MKKIIACCIFLSALLLTSNLTHAHNVWAHGNYIDPLVTVEFYRQSGHVYKSRSRMVQVWQEANSHLEDGVMAEFESKVNKESKVQPDEFKEALKGYKELKRAMADFDNAIRLLQEIDRKGEKTKLHQETLERILQEGRPMPRLARTGVRYSDAAGITKGRVSPLRNTTDILVAWREDLSILSSTLDEVIEGLRDAIPLAEKGEFGSVMLSGRNAFGDKMPQFTEMFSAYHRFYVRTVMATIVTTMQVYPAGYEWLSNDWLSSQK